MSDFTPAGASTPPHLPPSKLGTKEYWDALYTTELTNHSENPADEGTVWFDDSDAEAKIVSFLDEHALSDFGINPYSEAVNIIDLGCGNGSLLCALAESGWRGRLLGVDYSEKSVQLARGVSRERERRWKEEEGGDAEYGRVEFAMWDVIKGDLDVIIPKSEDGEKGKGFDVVLDKGTFDAISLSAEQDDRGRRINEGYGQRVLSLLRTGGIFVITSCNWTEAELKDWFEVKTEPTASGERLKVAGRIDYPSFSFGGVKGQTISTLCFEKVAV